jgi:arginase
MTDITIIENTSEIAAGTRGSSLGVQAIKIASIKENKKLFPSMKSIQIENQNHMIFNEVEMTYAKRIDGVIKVYDDLIKKLVPVLKSNSFPLIISGDHSNAGGSIAALKSAYPEKRLGVIWIDAHADLHSPYTSPSGNIHGMPLATALAEDNLEQMVNELDVKTIGKWDKLKNAGGISPKIDVADLVFVGVRSTERPEKSIMERNSIPNYTMLDIVKKGVDQTAKEILNYLSACDMLYVSFDVDSMDMELSQGTGTPVKDGLSKHQAIELIKRLVEDVRVKMFEVVEVNPLLDKKGNLMAEMALDSIIEVIKVLEER